MGGWSLVDPGVPIDRVGAVSSRGEREDPPKRVCGAGRSLQEWPRVIRVREPGVPWVALSVQRVFLLSAETLSASTFVCATANPGLPRPPWLAPKLA